MVGLGRYPKPDPDYQKFYYEQITLAKNRIAHFPLTNNLLDNFKNYENLNYKQTRNKIFLSCVHRIQWFDPSILYEHDKEVAKLKPIKYFENYSEYPYYVELLENSLSRFDVLHWNKKQYNSFKDRIASYDYFTSVSAFSEITTVFRIGTKIGFDNVQYEPSVSNGKNSDILVCLNGKEIYFELSSITESQASKKIQSILDDVAKYLFDKVKANNFFHFVVWLDTTKLTHTDGNIDEEKSKKLMFDWIDKLNLYELAGCNGLIPLSDYRYHSGIMKYSKKSLTEYPWNNPSMRKLFNEQPIINNWASKITISDSIFSPFVSIGCSDKVTSSSVEIQEDSMYSTHVELVDSNQFSSIQSGKLQEESFFNQILRKLSYKIKKEQFNRGMPVIFMLYGRLWSSAYETDSDDFSRIKNIVEKALKPYPYISGVLLYYTDYTNGKFIHNPNINPKINITDSELSVLFS